MNADRVVTIVDVANAAGVSHSTVSRVLNGYKHVSPATRAKVEKAAANLGYVANLNARSLAGGRTGVIGLVTLELSSSYVMAVARGVDEALAAAGYELMLCTTRERQQRERDYVTRLSNGLCDGLIVLIPSAAEHYIDQFADQKYPMVLVDYAPSEHWSTVTSQNSQVARLAVEHLIELGHRRIGHLAGSDYSDVAAQRINGWRQTLTHAGLDAGDKLIAQGDFRIESGQRGTGALLDLKDPPTAIFAASDEMAAGALRELDRRSLQCPADVSIVGVDDIPETQMLNPPLTTVRLPMDQMGREAARMLLRNLTEPGSPALHVELAVSLVVRSSTGPPPAS